MNKITDNIFNIKEYLTNHELLTFSVVTDKYIKLDIDRKKIKFNINHKNIVLAFEEHFQESENLINDVRDYINWLNEFNLIISSIDMIKSISDNFCKYRNFTTINDYYLNKRKKYRKDKIFYTTDFNTKGRYLYNEDICYIYNCRLRGKVLRNIKKSLTLKALIN